MKQKIPELTLSSDQPLLILRVGNLISAWQEVCRIHDNCWGQSIQLDVEEFPSLLLPKVEKFGDGSMARFFNT